MRCDKIEGVAARWPRPLLNPPHLVGNLDRDKLHRLLTDIEGLEIPATVGVEPRTVDRPGAIRRGAVRHRRRSGISRHRQAARIACGRGSCEDRRRPAQCERYLGQRQEQEFFISRFVDYASERWPVSQIPHRLRRWPALRLPSGDRRSLGHLVSQRRHVAERQPSASKKKTFMRAFDIEFARRHRDGAGRHRRHASVSIISPSIAPKPAMDRCWCSRPTIPRSSTTWIRPSCFPTSAADAQGVRCVRRDARSPRGEQQERAA